MHDGVNLREIDGLFQNQRLGSASFLMARYLFEAMHRYDMILLSQNFSIKTNGVGGVVV